MSPRPLSTCCSRVLCAPFTLLSVSFLFLFLLFRMSGTRRVWHDHERAASCAQHEPPRNAAEIHDVLHRAAACHRGNGRGLLLFEMINELEKSWRNSMLLEL